MTDKTGTVVVLAGGLSHEREVSLRSGRRVAVALRRRGYHVIETDLSASFWTELAEVDRPVVFPLLHGGAGEDGSVLQLLQLAGVPYVGSPAPAARIAFNKPVASHLARQAGFLVPRQVVLPFDIFAQLGAAPIMDEIVTHFSGPFIVKPAKCGSALGCSLVSSLDELAVALRAAYAYDPVAVFEEFVVGTEVAVSVVEVDGAPQALPVVQIQPKSGFYDYTARYTAGETRFLCPADLADSVVENCAGVALAAHRVFGLRYLSRTDLIVDQQGRPWFLEVSTAPGMTETSLLPLAVEASGLDFGEVCESLIEMALST